MIHYFTSITENYLAKARVLCKTLKEHNPTCKFYVGLTGDMPPNLNTAMEPFDGIILTHDLELITQKDIFFFKHTITEVCTALKPALALTLIQKFNAGKVVYLDPDIMVFSELNEIDLLLDRYSMVFTPHQLDFEEDDSYVVSNEILFLKRGTYNLGFFGVKADENGLKFLKWWNKRLLDYCFDEADESFDIPGLDRFPGMFTDQKWIDLVPAFFDGYHILKDPGYNVCTWNMTQRQIQKTGDYSYTVNGRPLRFFHFSGFDTGAHHNEMQRVIDYNQKNRDTVMLSARYKKRLMENGQKQVENIPYKYRDYSNGEFISNLERKILHLKRDLYNIFPNPFMVVEGSCYYKWVREVYGPYVEKSRRKQIAREISYKKALNLLFPPSTARGQWLRKMRRAIMGIKNIEAK
ncbi:MAG: hypothetical protein BWX99_00809 [Deltaproteobacteria bacterium ADurb.Bin151]|nr:MAG: hypothetical protein BWX99_00809 [Deltaproteobacteria bacterium ADurb.Bin151]